MSLAARLEAWRRRSGGFFPSATPVSAETIGVPFLANVPEFAALYPTARLIIEWAPGANLAAADTAWPWEDISEYVMQADGNAVVVSPVGRSDEATDTAPAGCAFMVKNFEGKFSRGPQSSSYGKIKLNIPVRVSVSLNGTLNAKKVRFYGFAYSMRPTWDSTGNYAVVRFQAAGIMRRLQQGSAPLRSALYRGITRDADVVAYWPMEDGEGAVALASGLPSGQPMAASGLTLAAFDPAIGLIQGSDSLPTFTSAGRISAPVSHTFSSHWQVNVFLNVASAPGADVAPLRINTTGTGLSRFEIVVPSGATNQVVLKAYDEGGVLALTSSTLTTTSGKPMDVRVSARQSGGNVEYLMVLFPADISAGGSIANGTVAGTVGNVFRVDCLPSANMNGVSMGHVRVFDDYDHAQSDGPQVGWLGDTPTSRINGLVSEEGFDDALISLTANDDSMGIQAPEKFLSLLREGEAVDYGGILGDGFNNSFYYVSRDDILNQDPRLTLDLSAGEVMPPFQPEDDDQRLLNKVTAGRKNGSSATFEDVDGPLGTAAINVYETSIGNINYRYDDQLLNYAGWVVHVNTVDGYRYPSVDINYATNPRLVSSWLDARPGFKLRLENVGDYISQHDPADIDLIVQGWSERLGYNEWSVELNCTSADPWTSAVAEDSTENSDTYDEYALRLDVVEGDSLVTVPYAANGGTLYVTAATGSENNWSGSDTDGIYSNFAISVAGYRAVVSNLNYSTFIEMTLAETIPVDIPVGAVVKLWHPSVWGL